MSNITVKLGRQIRDESPSLFKLAPTWENDWWGMPAFSMGDATPQHKITLNFMTAEDVRQFAKVTGLPVTTSSDSAWFPHQAPLRGRYRWDGPKLGSGYPVCIPTKGRAKTQTTGALLDKLGVDYLFFVEEHEAEEYSRFVGSKRVVKMPFSNLGQGSIPARNYIWDWAKENNHAKHWVLDDNIAAFYRTHHNRRLQVIGGGFFRAMETFVGRYSNIAMAGPHDIAFVPDRSSSLTPVLWNTRVYSCILIDTNLPHRWRGRYNEDTDLSLRFLKDGYSTCVFRALCMDKPATSGSKGHAMAGGNTDHVYNTGDSRRAFAESLRDQHPDIVDVVWKFNRWHHQVDYSSFDNNKPELRKGIVPRADIDDFGMSLIDSDENASDSGSAL